MIFLGKEIHEQRNYSDKVAEEIDEEVESLIKEAYSRAVEIITGNKPRLKYIADYLIEKETIDDTTFDKLLNDAIPTPDLETAPAS